MIKINTLAKLHKACKKAEQRVYKLINRYDKRCQKLYLCVYDVNNVSEIWRQLEYNNGNNAYSTEQHFITIYASEFADTFWKIDRGGKSRSVDLKAQEELRKLETAIDKAVEEHKQIMIQMLKEVHARYEKACERVKFIPSDDVWLIKKYNGLAKPHRLENLCCFCFSTESEAEKVLAEYGLTAHQFKTIANERNA